MCKRNSVKYDGRADPNKILKEETQQHEFKCWDCKSRTIDDFCELHEIEKVHTKQKLCFCMTFCQGVHTTVAEFLRKEAEKKLVAVQKPKITKKHKQVFIIKAGNIVPRLIQCKR